VRLVFVSVPNFMDSSIGLIDEVKAIASRVPADVVYPWFKSRAVITRRRAERVRSARSWNRA